MLKALALAVLACAVSVSAARAGEINSAGGLVIGVDWQTPEQLPPRFRNHCTFENFTSRPYCSNHCGIDYQFYYCSEASFGCCHLGHGYCDWNGVLRCHPVTRWCTTTTGMFFTLTTDRDITAAMQARFAQAISTARLTK